jgi:hypothetical protein
MNPIINALKATYNFFSGDAILLAAAALAFILTAFLVHAAHAPNVLVAILFIACIVGGLATTLGRERRAK